MMIAQTEIAKDTFAVCFQRRFGSGFGPSGEHKMAIDYFLDNTPQGQSPFSPSGGTSLATGIDRMCSDLQAYNFDQCVNIIIMDMAWSNSSAWRQQVFNDSLQFNYRDLEQKGPTL